MINQQIRVLSPMLLLAAFVTNAQAATSTVLSVNFYSDPIHVIPSDAGNTAGVIPASFWNNSTDAGLTAATLNDGTSHAIAVGLDVTASHIQIATPANNDQRLMGGSYDLHGGTQTLSVSGLPSAFTTAGYDVYVYTWGVDNANQQGLYEVALNGNSPVFIEQTISTFTGFDNSGQSESISGAGPANYVKLARVGPGQSSFEVDVSNIDGIDVEDWSVINGFQVVAVPEPGTATLLAIGAFSLARRRRPSM